jgi:hypothetical protein
VYGCVHVLRDLEIFDRANIKQNKYIHNSDF